MFDYICQATCLENKFPDVRVKEMGGVCPVINTVSVLHPPGDDIETLEFFQFRLYSAYGKTGPSLNLPHVERRIGSNPEEVAKNSRNTCRGDGRCQVWGLIPRRRAVSHLADRNALHAVARTDGVHDVLARYNLSKDRVLAVEMSLRRVGDEKLAPVCARSGVCH
jgi:hypothetical protein